MSSVIRKRRNFRLNNIQMVHCNGELVLRNAKVAGQALKLAGVFLRRNVPA